MDNRPPILVESDYESWKIRIERYIRGKPLGKLIWRSIQNGPTLHPQITETEGQGASSVQVTRHKMDEEFIEIENNRELADIQATNILSQELLRNVFNILNQTRSGKEIWDNVELLMKAYLASITYHLMLIQPTNLPPSTTSLTLSPQPAAQSSNDVMLETMNQIVNLLSGFQKQFPPTNNQLRTSSNSRNHATMHDGQIFTETIQRKAPGNVGNTCTKGIQSYEQVIDNKGKLVICYNCHGEGHVSRQCKEKKKVKYSQYFKDKMLLMETKKKEAVLDAVVEAFLADVEFTAPYDQPLAITTTNIFEVTHEDAYDSDVDEGPHATTAFMANLSSTNGKNGATTSHVNEVHTDDNQIFDNVNHLYAHEMHQEEHLDFNVDSDIDDNTILYHQYQLDSEVQDVPTEVSSVSPGEIYMITILDDLRKQLDGHLKVYWLPAEELATQKSNPPKPVTPFVHTRPTPSKVHTQLLKLKDSFLAFETIIKRRTTPTFHEQGEWRFIHTKKAFTKKVIPFYEHVKELVQSLDENLVKEVTEFMQIFDELDKEYEQCILEKKKLQIKKKNLLIQNECLITDCIAKDICSIVLASDRDRPLGEELSSNCVRENSKVIELEAKILKQQQMLAESNKRCSFDKQALETKLIQLKDAITLVRIQNDGFTVENVNLKRRYQELSTSNSQLRDTLTRKINALTAGNAKLKSESLNKMHSEAILHEKPKVLTPGMYAIISKYIVPPRRVNRAEPTPLPNFESSFFTLFWII
nr:hypothetical protein [Tanacetum cinerariifolium]